MKHHADARACPAGRPGAADAPRGPGGKVNKVYSSSSSCSQIKFSDAFSSSKDKSDAVKSPPRCPYLDGRAHTRYKIKATRPTPLTARDVEISVPVFEQRSD